MKQNSNSIETTLELNTAWFLAEYFAGSTGTKDQFCVLKVTRVYSVVLLIPYWRLTRRANTAMNICRENTVQIIARLQSIGCGINSDVLTSMKPITAPTVVRLKPTSVMQSMRRGLGSTQAS